METEHSCSVNEVLISLGYSLRDCGREYRTTPLYRDSSNPSSLKIDKKTGKWVDFSANISGTLDDLVKLTLNLPNSESAVKWLESKNFKFSPLQVKSQIKMIKYYPQELLKELEADHSYWVGRKVPEPILLEFKGGVAKKGRLMGRYVFPIFDENERIIGFTGRDLWKGYKDRAKWKIIGPKHNFIYPFFLNKKEALSEEIILVESIGDCLSLFSAGIRNVLVLFGVNLSPKQHSFLLRVDPKKIVISVNNDFEKEENTGLEAALKIRNSLINNFNKDKVIINLPTKKDFGEMTPEEIKIWHEDSKH